MREPIRGKDDRQRLGHMRGDAVHDLLFVAGLVNQADMPLGQIAQSAVQKPRGSAAGAEGQIVLFDQPDAQAAHGGIAGNARAHDPPADDQHVEFGGG